MKLTKAEKAKLLRTIDGLQDAVLSYAGQFAPNERDKVGEVIHALTEIHDGVERVL